MSQGPREHVKGRSTAPDGELANQVSSRRRHLLKAAASAGPLIATLPSGEALAAASALQCVINEQNATEQPDGVLPGPPAPGPPPDNYIRIPGKREFYFSITPPPNGAGAGTIEVYRFNDQNGDEILIVGDNAGTSVSPIAPPGTWFDPSTALFKSAEEDVWFLRMYYADPNPITGPADVAVDETGVDADGFPAPSEACTIENPPGGWNTGSPPPPTAPRTGPDGTSGRDCIYPLAVQVDPGSPGNIPLTGSCLTSFTGP